MEKLNFHEQLKQCAIYSYGKNQQLPENSKCINHYENPKSGFSASVIKKGNEIIIAYVEGYTRTCYVHGGNVLRGYLGKAVKDMSQAEIDEFLDDYI